MVRKSLWVLVFWLACAATARADLIDDSDDRPAPPPRSVPKTRPATEASQVPGRSTMALPAADESLRLALAALALSMALASGGLYVARRGEQS